MARTIGEQKKRYYKLVLEKANEIYASWQTNGIKSKRLVAQANEYALDNRLKLVANYRFYALAFTVALGIRLERRYGTFFRRLFYLFPFLRERAALKRLKRVFGFHGDTDIREMIEVEAEKIIVLFSQQQNRWSTGGGKRAELGEIAFEEALDAFFKECAQEEQKSIEHHIDIDATERVDTRGEAFPTKADDTQREKVYVEELGSDEQVVEQMKKANTSTKISQSEKQTKSTLETDIAKNDKTEKSVDKTLANTSILAEAMLSKYEKEKTSPSPFPVFRERSEEKIAVSGKETPILEKEKNETRQGREKGENLDKDIRTEAARDKSPFPVFNVEKAAAVREPERVPKKEIREVKENKEIKEIKETQEIKPAEEKTVRVQVEISEENKARIALSSTLRKEEIEAIAMQIKEAAKMVMEGEERVLREQISVADGVHSMQSTSKVLENTKNNRPLSKK